MKLGVMFFSDSHHVMLTKLKARYRVEQISVRFFGSAIVQKKYMLLLQQAPARLLLSHSLT